MTASLATAHDCLKRAVSIKNSAKGLLAANNEWHAVCYFYAAYHTVKAAFIEDAVFDSPKDLVAISPSLIMGDRFATSHKGYVGPKERGRKLGVNDIVRLIYPDIAADYVLLHVASIDVRYGAGLTTIASPTVVASYDAVVAAYSSGKLKASLA